MRKSHDYIVLIFKGMAMMAAELFPGVSAASVAKYTGLYREAVDTLSHVSLRKSIRGIRSGRFLWWKRLNISFIVALLFGALLSLFSLTRLIYELQTETPILIKAFFLGVLFSSLLFLFRKIARWDIINSTALTVGFLITTLINLIHINEPIVLSNISFAFLGLITGVVILLPGVALISFVQYVVVDFSQINYSQWCIFLLFLILGLLVTSRIITRLYKTFRNTTYALLLGTIAGGFIRLWPWQLHNDSPNKLVQTFANNQLTSPHQYEILYGDNQWLLAVILFIAGAAIALVAQLLLDGKKL